MSAAIECRMFCLLISYPRIGEIFQPRSKEVTREWRKLHDEELYDVYPSLNVIRVVKSGRMKWHDMWHVW